MTRDQKLSCNNFNTRLGHSIGRMFASLFHFNPQFQGRAVVTFHNQRDFIFFRHHRYEFKDGKRVAIQEVGPRFTLKLRWLQKGTFDTKTGEFEWLLKVTFDLVTRKVIYINFVNSETRNGNKSPAVLLVSSLHDGHDVVWFFAHHILASALLGSSSS